MSNKILNAALVLAACTTSLATTRQASAQSMEPNRIGSWEFGVSGGALILDSSLRDFLGSGAPENRFASSPTPSSGMFTGEARMGYNFTRHVAVEIGLEDAVGSGMNLLSPTEAIVFTTDINARTAPFVSIGTELTRIDGENARVTHSTWGASAGLGVRHMIGDNVALRLEGRLRVNGYNEVPMTRTVTYSPMVQLGFSFFTHGRRAERVVETRVDTVRAFRVDTVRTERFRVDTVRMASPMMPAPAPARARELFTLKAVLFEFNQSTLTGGAKDTLRVAVRYLKEHDDVRVEIQGNTDSKGSDDYNMKLGMRRAVSVKSYLSAQGISGDRISTKSLGESQPVAENKVDGKDNPAGRALNRRVVIIELP